MREKVKKLWKLCFNDNDEFVDMYFNLRYNSEVNVAIESGDEVIAALQMLPYPITFHGNSVPTAYISGACTHPDYRSRGVMRELLSQAFGRMYRNNIALTTLIPAEPWLFGYYARVGYATAFRYGKRTFHLPTSETDTSSLTSSAKTGWCFQAYTDYDEDVYQYMRKYMIDKIAAKKHASTAKMELVPGFYKIYSFIFLKIMRTTDLQENTQSYGKDHYDVTITKCLWHTACKENGCEELCHLFCDVDDVTYGGLKKIGFTRTKTLGYGGDCCNFHFFKK